MKYVILSLIILLISITFGILIVFLLNKIFKTKLKKRFNILIVFGTTMLLILLSFIIFALDY